MRSQIVQRLQQTNKLVPGCQTVHPFFQEKVYVTSQVATERDAVRGGVGVGKLPEGGPVGCRPLMCRSDLDRKEATGGDFHRDNAEPKCPGC